MANSTPISSKAGLIAIGIKVGPKLLSALVKFAKFIKVGKTGLAAASFGAYAVLFSWEFSLVLLGSLFIHEYGHIWQMRREGLQVRGIYFIPLLGAAAVADGAFPSRAGESRIALMGPLWGLFTALAVLSLYPLTKSPLVAALAGWIAMVNLFNLLPINPLDGGRVIKSIAFSWSDGWGKLIMFSGLLAAITLAYLANFGLILFLLVIGGIELWLERKRIYQEEDIRRVSEALKSWFSLPENSTVEELIEKIDEHLDSACELNKLRVSDETIAHQDVVLKFLSEHGIKVEWADCVVKIDSKMFPSIFAAAVLESLARHARHRYRGLGISEMSWKGSLVIKTKYCTKSYELSVFPSRDSREESGLYSFLRTRSVPKMSTWQMGLYTAAYIGLCCALSAVMYLVAHVPAAKMALEVFADI
jgi:Zn-dependent protease